MGKETVSFPPSKPETCDDCGKTYQSSLGHVCTGPQAGSK